MGLSGGGLEGLTSSQPASIAGLGIWKYRTEIVSPPASGEIRFNNADPSLATQVFIHETNRDGTDIAAFLALIVVDSILYLQDRRNADNFFIIEVASNVDSGVFRTIGIDTIILQGDEPGQNTDVVLVVS